MNDSTTQLRFIDLKQVCDRVGLGKTTVLLWEAQERFPRAVRLSATKRVWFEPDVHDWMLARRGESLGLDREAS